MTDLEIVELALRRTFIKIQTNQHIADEQRTSLALVVKGIQLELNKLIQEHRPQ